VQRSLVLGRLTCLPIPAGAAGKAAVQRMLTGTKMFKKHDCQDSTHQCNLAS